MPAHYNPPQLPSIVDWTLSCGRTTHRLQLIRGSLHLEAHTPTAIARETLCAALGRTPSPCVQAWLALKQLQELNQSLLTLSPDLFPLVVCRTILLLRKARQDERTALTVQDPGRHTLRQLVAARYFQPLLTRLAAYPLMPVIKASWLPNTRMPTLVFATAPTDPLLHYRAPHWHITPSSPRRFAHETRFFPNADLALLLMTEWTEARSASSIPSVFSGKPDHRAGLSVF